MVQAATKPRYSQMLGKMYRFQEPAFWGGDVSGFLPNPFDRSYHDDPAVVLEVTPTGTAAVLNMSLHPKRALLKHIPISFTPDSGP